MTSNDRAQSTVELALGLPLVTLVVLAVFQFSSIARDRIAMVHAAREGARAATVEPTRAAVLAAVEQSVALDRRRLAVEIHGGADPGDLVTVIVRYRSATSTPLIGTVLPDVELTEQFVAVVE